MMTAAIRPGVLADAAALAELAARTFHDTFAAENNPQDMALHSAQKYGVAQQSAELLDENICTLLAEIDGALAGYAQLQRGPAPPCVTGDAPMELWRLYVAQEWHGRGVALVLMNAVDTEVRKRGARTLWLGVWERNARAKAFYGKYGFTDVGAHTFMLGTDKQVDRIWVRSIELPASTGTIPSTGTT